MVWSVLSRAPHQPVGTPPQRTLTRLFSTAAPRSLQQQSLKDTVGSRGTKKPPPAAADTNIQYKSPSGSQCGAGEKSHTATVMVSEGHCVGGRPGPAPPALPLAGTLHVQSHMHSQHLTLSTSTSPLWLLQHHRGSATMGGGGLAPAHLTACRHLRDGCCLFHCLFIKAS
ncbi:hypothetical protein O3P69_009855 [Scylla paramamosain]|uniref:Uncharacterized protein n=1 Tax=Scylla paramamosain TaxID=85552 RepID=A0AAW0SQR0_SCYPA